MLNRLSFLWLAAAILALVIGSGVVIACGGDDDDDDDDDAVDDDMDDDDDDDTDDDVDDDADDDADDDTGECEVTEAEVCDWLVNACDDMYGLGDTAFCESVYEEDCASGSIGDVDGFLSCVCGCMAADVSCEDTENAAFCEGSCFTDFCGSL